SRDSEACPTRPWSETMYSPVMNQGATSRRPWLRLALAAAVGILVVVALNVLLIQWLTASRGVSDAGVASEMVASGGVEGDRDPAGSKTRLRAWEGFPNADNDIKPEPRATSALKPAALPA